MQQYEIIISDVVHYEGDCVSNEEVLPTDEDYFDNDGSLTAEYAAWL